jgi:hypothetical protein
VQTCTRLARNLRRTCATVPACSKGSQTAPRNSGRRTKLAARRFTNAATCGEGFSGPGFVILSSRSWARVGVCAACVFGAYRASLGRDRRRCSSGVRSVKKNIARTPPRARKGSHKHDGWLLSSLRSGRTHTTHFLLATLRTLYGVTGVRPIRTQSHQRSYAMRELFRHLARCR